jgi:uncharacterized protein (TIGR00375 family)
MKFIADFHLHSKYSRATSQQMNLENLSEWGKLKGIKILGTGDFTFFAWFKEIKEKLEPAEPGLFKLKNGKNETRFILTTEVSCVYKKREEIKKIHIIIFAPSLETVEKINNRLHIFGNLNVDGRPTLNLDAKELVKIVLDVSENCLIAPAHIWTPWFSLFGSRSGFNSIEECFQEYSEYIFSGETGLSSDPPMNWRLSALDRITLISNSDAHSLSNIGREANVFETEIDYPSILEAIKTKNPKKFLYTIEFFPEEGKYHYDGHRICGVSLSPTETKKYNGICPVCKKPLTIGVLNRVEQLADRPEGFVPNNAIPFKSLIPLKEILSEAIGATAQSEKIQKEYQKLIKEFGNEFNILLETKTEDIEKVAGEKIAFAIEKMRKGEVIKEPGYDGVYGKIKIFGKKEIQKTKKQGLLF